MLVLTKSRIVRKIQALAEIPSAGPPAGFTYAHVCCALLLIGDEEAVGRIQLSKKLGLGEGMVRTIIRHLSNAGIIKSTREGCTLTPKGLSLYRRLRNRFSNAFTIDAKQLSLDSASTAVLVKGVAGRVRQGIEQRDAAVRTGAAGACTLLMKNERFVMPMGSDEWKLNDDDTIVKELKDMFHPKENDVIIIASAREKRLVNYAAIAAGLTLVE